MLAKDRFGNVLRKGYKVADLRVGSTKTGEVMGVRIGKVLVCWNDDEDDEEWLDDIDVMQTDRVTVQRRGHRHGT